MANSNRKNYSKISTEEVKAKQTEETKVKSSLEPAEPEVKEKVESKPKAKSEVVKGVVVDCSKLNMRTAPSTDAEIRGTLDKGVTVIILGEEGEFYKIGNPENPDYCMKKYISIKK